MSHDQRVARNGTCKKEVDKSIHSRHHSFDLPVEVQVLLEKSSTPSKPLVTIRIPYILFYTSNPSDNAFFLSPGFKRNELAITTSSQTRKWILLSTR